MKKRLDREALEKVESQVRLACVADTISQLFKVVLEALISPITCAGFLVFSVVSIPIGLYKGDNVWSDVISGLVISVALPIISVVGRIYLIGIDLIGSVNLINPNTVAAARQESVKDRSLLDVAAALVTLPCED